MTEPDHGPAGSGALLVPLDGLALSDTAAQDHRRGVRDDGSLQGLADSIASEGLLSPVLVRRDLDPGADRPWILVAGERRVEAHRLLGRAEIPAFEVDRDAADLAQLVENLQREGLDPMTEAIAYRDLVAGGLSTEEIARRAGRGETTVRSRLSLAKLPDEARAALKEGRIVVATAELIARFPADDRVDVLNATLPEPWRNSRSVPYDEAEMKVLRSPFVAGAHQGGFDARDDKLGGRGACHGCEYYQNAGGVFAHRCFDTACWTEKSDKAAARSLANGADDPVEAYSAKRHYLPNDRMVGPDGVWETVPQVLDKLGAEPQRYSGVVRAERRPVPRRAKHLTFWRRKDVRGLLPEDGGAQREGVRGDAFGWLDSIELGRRLWKLLADDGPGRGKAGPDDAAVLEWMVSRLDETEVELVDEACPDRDALTPLGRKRLIARLLDLECDAYVPAETAARERGIDVEAVKAGILKEKKQC